MANKKTDISLTAIFFSACFFIWLIGYSWTAFFLAAAGVFIKALLLFAKNAPKSFDINNMYEWKWGEGYDTEVVGESNYQKELFALSKLGKQHYAVLFPENDNEYDSKAVAIFIDGLKVGYLPRDCARTFRRRLKKENLEDRPTKAKALILGGHQLKDRRTADFGIYLNIKPF